ncbi:MFS transporter [Solwaraspora sp. WMMD1047]|uniref:MFS transporter n=1 Tax=Solwaraspora sp. WMMD1047 TaxID=3016102 RepID=UPI002417D889|nr:MFS transporter [Solwaraspora sp. WMMD1047]MDG4834254.1 MFS transporter [Solwaraspora sp. WMMD1047]
MFRRYLSRVGLTMVMKEWLRAYVPATPSARTLMVVTITDAVGGGLYLSGSVIYFVDGIGLPAGSVGAALTVAGLAGFLASVPLGMLGDRIGTKRLLIGLQAWRALMLVALSFVTGLPGFLLAAIGLTIAARSVSPATQAVVAVVMSEKDRVTTMALMRSVRNVGYSVGAALTIPIFAADNPSAYKLIMLGNAATFVLSVLLLLRLKVPSAVPLPAGRRRFPQGVRDWPFVRLAMVNGVLSLHMTMLSVGIPLWALASGAPTWTVSLLFILNTVLTVLLQVASARGSGHPGFGDRALRRSAVALVACCVIFAAASLGDQWVAVAALTAGAVALTAGELLQSAGGWELSFRHSPADRRAEYLAAFNLGPAAIDIVGPVLLTAVVAYRSPGWLALAAVFAVAGLLVRPAVRSLG